MARIEWVKQRLLNWAAWKARESRGSLGFYTASAFTKMVVDTSGYRETASTVDDVEAQQTDLAVQSLRSAKPHLHRTVELIYLEDAGIKGAAMQLCRAESTVKAQLEQVDLAIATWLRNKAQERERAEGSGSFTT